MDAEASRSMAKWKILEQLKRIIYLWLIWRRHGARVFQWAIAQDLPQDHEACDQRRLQWTERIANLQ